MVSEMEYVRRGSGEPLLLVHGLGGDRSTWSPVIDGLAADHDVIAVDLPGFGSSPPLPDGTTPTPGRSRSRWRHCSTSSA